MNWLADKNKISDLSIELGIAKPFIEKDLYMIRILQLLKNLNTDEIQFVFAGGTCLSKTYAFLKRFSEDIDFIVSGASKLNRSKRSELLKKVVNTISANSDLSVYDVNQQNESKAFSCYVDYPKQFEIGKGLRPSLKIDISFIEPTIPPETHQIKTFFYQFDKTSPIVDFDCISLIETAANKVNALIWRTTIKDRNSDNLINNDPNLVRHLYDLSNIKSYIINNSQFKELTHKIYETDKERAKNNDLPFKNAIDKAIFSLKSDKYYIEEYDIFVGNLVYKDNVHIEYDKALEDFEEISNFLCK